MSDPSKNRVETTDTDDETKSLTGNIMMDLNDEIRSHETPISSEEVTWQKKPQLIR